MMEVDAGCGSPGPIYILKTSREESKQQIAIPSTASVRPLLLVHPRARSSPVASSSLSTGKKPSAEKDTPPQTNGTMSVSQKVKKIGKPRAPLAMDRYIALISCNGTTAISFMCNFISFLLYSIFSFSFLCSVVNPLETRTDF